MTRYCQQTKMSMVQPILQTTTKLAFPSSDWFMHSQWATLTSSISFNLTTSLSGNPEGLMLVTSSQTLYTKKLNNLSKDWMTMRKVLQGVQVHSNYNQKFSSYLLWVVITLFDEWHPQFLVAWSITTAILYGAIFHKTFTRNQAFYFHTSYFKYIQHNTISIYTLILYTIYNIDKVTVSRLLFTKFFFAN